MVTPKCDLDLWVRVEKALAILSYRYEWFNKFLSLGLDGGLRKKIAKRIDDKDVVLELGSGPGTMAKLINCREYWGLDPLEVMVKIAKSRVKKQNFNFVKGCAEDIPFENNYFDKVIATFAFRDFKDKIQALKETYRVLKKGGEFIILDMANLDIPSVKLLRLFYKFMGKFNAVVTGDYFKESIDHFTKTIEVFAPPSLIGKWAIETGFSQVKVKYYLFGTVFELTAKK